VSSPYVGEVRMFAGNFAPVGWALCQGQLMSISENEVLFQLIGTTYGGDGINTFGLPDLRGRVPIHQGTGFAQGQIGGEEAHTLTTNEMPAHSHNVMALGAANSQKPASAVYGGGTANLNIYENNPATGTTMNAGIITPNPGGQPHDNMMPYLAINFIISLFGIFPSQN